MPLGIVLPGSSTLLRSTAAQADGFSSPLLQWRTGHTGPTILPLPRLDWQREEELKPTPVLFTHPSIRHRLGCEEEML